MQQKSRHKSDFVHPTYPISTLWFHTWFFLPDVLRVPSFVANRHILPSCWTFQRVGCLWIIKKTSLVSYCLITSTQEETFREHITFNTQLLLIWCTYASLFCQVSLWKNRQIWHATSSNKSTLQFQNCNTTGTCSPRQRFCILSLKQSLTFCTTAALSP